MAANRRNRLARVDADTFTTRRKGARTLNAAADDGYTLTDRTELVDREILVVMWEIKPGYGGTPFATVWGMVQEETDIRRIKLQDGGRNIPATLEELEANGVTGDVLVRLRATEYGHELDGGPFVSYRFTDPNEPDSDEPGF